MHGRCLINQRSNQAYFYITLAVIGIAILAAGLSNLQFQPGLPIPGAEPEVLVPAQVTRTDRTTPEIGFPVFVQVLFGLALIGFIVFWVSGLIRNSNKKQLVRIGLALVGMVILYLVFPRTEPNTQITSVGQEPAIEVSARPEYNVAPVGDPPVYFIWIVAGLLGLAALVGILVFALRIYRQWKVSSALKEEVESALQDVYDGADLRNIILRCYLQMINILKLEHGIERDEALTPREFERLLEASGIPDEPIRQLTNLFERVRYGSKPTTEKDEQEAINSLAAIRTACQSMKRIRV